MKTDSKYNLSEVSTYKRIEFILSQIEPDADEDEGKLRYKKSPYELRAWLSGDEFEYEYLVNNESLELEEPEQDLIWTALEKAIEKERTYANDNPYEEPYFYLTHNV